MTRSSRARPRPRRVTKQLLRLLELEAAWVDAPDAGARDKVEDTAQRQLWGTPEEFVRGLEVISGRKITLDVCAERRTAKAERYFGVGSPLGLVDALRAPSWAPYTEREDTGYMNPDFRRKAEWVDKIMQEGLPGFAVVPGATEQPWFGDLHETEHAHLSVLTGRLAFVPPPGIKESSPREGVVVWALNFPERVLPPRLVTEEVKAIGRRAPEGRAA